LGLVQFEFESEFPVTGTFYLDIDLSLKVDNMSVNWVDANVGESHDLRDWFDLETYSGQVSDDLTEGGFFGLSGEWTPEGPTPAEVHMFLEATDDEIRFVGEYYPDPYYCVWLNTQIRLVPEPGTVLLLGLGVVMARRRR
jgi:hypothetical protein